MVKEGAIEFRGLDGQHSEDRYGPCFVLRLYRGREQNLIPFLQHCQRTYPVELHALNNLEHIMQGGSCVSLYEHEGYSWSVQTWRHGRQVWDKLGENKILGSWEPEGRLPREQVPEWYRKWRLFL